MNRARLLAVARKEFIHVLRDWRSLALAIAIPMLLISLFGYALNLDVDNVPTAVWDQSHTPESRELLSLLDGSPYFVLESYHDDYRELQQALDSGRVLIAVVIPSDFADAVQANKPTSIQIIADGSDANTGRLILGYATALGMIYNQRLTVERMQLLGQPPVALPVELAYRAWYNPDLRSSNNIIPGIFAVVMMVIAALLTSVTVAKEWELGTMEQLISTPVRGPELVFGKLTPYLVIGFVDVAIAVAMGEWVFNVPLRGSPGLLFGIAAVFLIGALCMGITLSIVVKKQVLAIQIALVGTFLPTMLLSGFVFAIPNMPLLVQYLTYIVPARYFITLMRGVYLKGIGLEIMWPSALVLVIWAVLVLILANRRLRLKLD
jgi:ABC-2 type transport system permease protein